MKRSASKPGLSNALQAVTPCTKLKRRSKILTLCYLTYLVFYSKLFTFYALLVFYVTLRSILTSKGNKENLSESVKGDIPYVRSLLMSYSC